jgi:hypothetical protein
MDMLDFTDDELRGTPDLVVIYRMQAARSVYVREPSVPVAVCLLSHVPFQLPSLRQANADVPGAEFFWRDVCSVPAPDLAHLRERMAQQDVVRKYLRSLERQFETGG